jgi:hypothetical protein
MDRNPLEPDLRNQRIKVLPTESVDTYLTMNRRKRWLFWILGDKARWKI